MTWGLVIAGRNVKCFSTCWLYTSEFSSWTDDNRAVIENWTCNNILNMLPNSQSNGEQVWIRTSWAPYKVCKVWSRCKLGSLLACFVRVTLSVTLVGWPTKLDCAHLHPSETVRKLPWLSGWCRARSTLVQSRSTFERLELVRVARVQPKLIAIAERKLASVLATTVEPEWFWRVTRTKGNDPDLWGHWSDEEEQGISSISSGRDAFEVSNAFAAANALEPVNSSWFRFGSREARTAEAQVCVKHYPKWSVRIADRIRMEYLALNKLY